MIVTLLNSKKELDSFPIKQNIKILFSEEVSEAFLKQNIFLFRLQAENSLVNLSEPYSYTLGYIKETFDLLDLNFKVSETSEGFEVTVDPLLPLNVSSTYCLIVSKEVTSSRLKVEKISSKSSSQIKVKTEKDYLPSFEVDVEVLTNSLLKENSNLVEFSIDGSKYVVDVRGKKPFINYKDLIIAFEGIYLKGEAFKINIEGSLNNSGEDLTYIIKTVSSSSIAPLELSESSTFISNQDILNFYSNMNKSSTEVSERYESKYVDYDSFYIPIPEGFELNKEEEIKARIGVAFNNYILRNMGLYKEDKKYILLYFVDTDLQNIIFKLEESKDPAQTEKIIVLEDF